MPSSRMYGVPKSVYSEVYVDTPNDHASTATNIKIYSNLVRSIGSSIQYLPDSVNGDSFLIKETGMYTIDHMASTNNGSNVIFGVSLNAQQVVSGLTTNIDVLPSANRLGETSAINGATKSALSVTCYLRAGDVIRAHDDGVNSGGLTGATRGYFRITRTA